MTGRKATAFLDRFCYIRQADGTLSPGTILDLKERYGALRCVVSCSKLALAANLDWPSQRVASGDVTVDATRVFVTATLPGPSGAITDSMEFASVADLMAAP